MAGELSRGRRGHVNGATRTTPVRGRGHVVTSPIAWSGRTQDNQSVERQVVRIIHETGGGTGGGAPAGADGDIQYNDDGELAGKPVWQFGYWTPITNGDPATAANERLIDSQGDCVVGFVPTP